MHNTILQPLNFRYTTTAKSPLSIHMLEGEERKTVYLQLDRGEEDKVAIPWVEYILAVEHDRA